MITTRTTSVRSILCLALLAAGAVYAQDTRAKVQGVIKDSTQAIIVGAQIVLSNDNTGVQTVEHSSTAGQYLFDFVLPGNYTLTVETPGFRKFVQKNILVQSRGDVTVDAVLEVGSIGESITIDATPVAVQFNTSTMSLTVDTKMANSLPILNRNPYLLVALNPATVTRSTTEQSPFHHWAASQFDVGGNTNDKNDIILDGSPAMTTQKNSYTPPMDAVQEVNVQQNSVDAEFGHSAGGVLTMQMKSGTNELHGTTYYLGRNPSLNAAANSINHAPNLTRQNVWGVTAGAPIKKNKLFNFFAYEGWRQTQPLSYQSTLPTDIERTGDFSKTLNAAGGLRTIYDPFTTQTDSAGVVTRTPFAGNVIPASRIDPTAKVMMGDIWKPNRAGDDFTGVNNFQTGYGNRFKYWNISDRADWNVSDRWKTFFRYNQFRTFTQADDYTQGSVAEPVDGSKRHARSFSGDAVFTLNPTTVLNFRGAYNGIVDSFGLPSATLQPKDLQRFWGSNTWYLPYLSALPDIYYPAVTVNHLTAATTLGKSTYWYQQPHSFNLETKMSKNVGRHYMKVGAEFRREDVDAARPTPMSFVFNPDLTANTYNSPNTNLSGNAWATFLLGAIDNKSTDSSIPIQKPRVNYVGLFVQDDFKLSQRLTLNLGLRYEYYTPMKDADGRLSRYLDLTNPIPEFQGANAPVLPPEVTALRTAAPIYNGAWVFTDSNHPGAWNPQKFLLMPRVGVAWRIDNNTALRAGWARFIIPPTLTDGLNILGSVPLPGFDANTAAIGQIAGVPQQVLSNPYPGGLVGIVGKTLGRYTNLGGTGTWYQQNFNAGVNDRFNISVQRQLPWKVVADITYFINYGRNQPYTFDVNQIDPRIGYQYKNAINASVANPFYNLLPPNQEPGQLRTQKNIAVSELLRAYPQYSSLTETLRGGWGDHYQALQMSFQRPFANGFNFVVGYNYNRERTQQYYDSVDNFTNTPTYQDSVNPRHRLTGAAIYELPFGKGRKLMSNANRLLDGVLGGWSTSGLYTYNSGDFLRFGTMLVSGDPHLDHPTNARWFDTSMFQVQPAFTRRTNPLQYDDVKGPRFVNLDMTLAKMFPIKERIKFELRLESYNITNSFSGADPNLNVTGGTAFGRITSQKAGVYGRQFQYSGRFIW
jgi:hypothetical protein